jgi:hypothetical protein
MSVPDAPTFTSQPLVVNSTTVTVEFSLGSDGGSALEAIEYARDTDNYATWVSLPGLTTPLENNTSATITGLTPSVYGSYKIRAVNAIGNSESTAEAAYLLNAGEYYTKVVFSSDNQYAIARKFNDGGVDQAAVSSNSGVTWTAITPPEGNPCTDVAMSSNGQHMYYTTYNSGAGAGEVYHSDDYGANFLELSNAPPLVSHMACNSTGEKVYCPSRFDFNMYVSTDYGANFTLTANVASIGGVACSTSGQYVYMAGSGTIVFSSTDYGVTFAQAPYSFGLISEIKCDSTGQKVIIATNDGIAYSLDYSVSMVRLSIPASNYTSVAFNSVGNRIVVLAADGTISVSYDAGTTWTAQTIIGQSTTFTSGGVSISPDGTRYVYSLGTPGTYIKSEGTVDVAPISTALANVSYYNGSISTDNQRIVAVRYNADTNTTVVVRSSNAGESWDEADDFGLVNMVVASASGEIVLAMMDDYQLPYVSTDYGQNFTITTLSPVETIPFNRAIINLSGTTMMAISGDYNDSNVYLSTDTGLTWSNPYTFTNGNVIRVCSSATMDRIYVTFYSYGDNLTYIYGSTDMGTSWAILGDSPPTYNQIEMLTCDWTGRILIAATIDLELKRSTDYGVTWTLVTTPSIPETIGIIKSNFTGNRVLISDTVDSPVYVSLDACETWTALSTPDLFDNTKYGTMISPDGSLAITASNRNTYLQTLGLGETTAPLMPTFTSLPVIVDTSTITIEFDLSYNGGSALTAIQYARATDNYATWTTITGLTTPLEDVTSATITGLTPSIYGSYKLRSVNSIGNSAPSAATTVYLLNAGEYYPKVLFSSNNQYAIALKFNEGGNDQPAVSSDGGVTWTAITVPGGSSCNDVAMSLDGTIMYYTAYGSGTYKSTAHSTTFLPVENAPLYPLFIVCDSTGQRVFIKSDNDSYIYASDDAGDGFTQGANLDFAVVSVACNASGDHIYLVTGVDVFVSTNYGLSFTIASTLDDIVTSVTCDQTGKLVFASTMGSFGVYVSVNYGESFVRTTYNSDNSDNVLHVMCDSLGNRLTSLSQNGIIRVSYNAGTTWVTLPPIPGQSLTFTSGGVSISPDGTRYVSTLGAPGTYIAIEGTPDTVPYWSVINGVSYFNGSISTDNQNIVVRKYDYDANLSTVAYSRNEGATWNDTPDFGDVQRVVASASGEIVLALINDGEVPWISTDYGESFNVIPLVPFGFAPDRLAVMDSTGEYMMMIAESGHVYTSANSGGEWYSPHQFTDGNDFRAICANTSLDKVYVIFTSNTNGDSYIYRSTNMGVSWMPVSANPSPSGIRDIACDWSGQKLVLTTNDNNIYRSTNGGDTWTLLQLPVINSAYDIAPQKIVSNSTGNRLAFTDPNNWYLTFFSIDAGATWSALSAPDTWWNVPQGNIISPDGSFVMTASGYNTYVQTLGAADLPPGSATAPAAPSFTSSPTIISNTSISIDFTLGADGGSTITGIEYARAPSYNTWIPISGLTSPVTITVDSPSTGGYKIRAVNAIGPSDPSAEDFVLAIAPAAPSFTSPPTAVSPTSIDIVFSLGFNGGLDLIDLEYAREEDSYTAWTSIGLSLPLEGRTTATITGLTPLVTGNYKIRAVNDVGPSAASEAGLVSGTIPCFLEGSKILCMVDGVEKYVAIETIRPGTLVKTSRDGFKPVKLIGSRVMVNAGGDERDKNSLYLCTKANYPELTEDLIITGCHAILVDHITDVQRQGIINTLERVFVTDKKYRLPACVDERAPVYQTTGTFTVWHFALEHTDIKMNYGVYAHGLLVETSPIWHMNTRNYRLVQ